MSERVRRNFATRRARSSIVSHRDTLEAGEILFIPAGSIHAARYVGTGNGAELATYIVEKGRPLPAIVK